MKIAIILPDFGDSGTRRVGLTLAGGFEAKGCLVDLVVGRAEGVYRKDIPPGVRTIDLNVRAVSPVWVRQILSFFPLVSYFKNRPPDMVLPIFDYFESIVLLAIRCALLPARDRPLTVYSIHNDIRFLEDLPPYKRFVVRLLKKDVLRRADRVVAVSRGVAASWADYFRFPIGRIEVVYNPIDISKIRTLALEKISHAWFQPNEPPVILGLGRLSPQKEFSTLIRAFARVRKQHEARLIILGEGKERARLEALVNELGLAECVDLPASLRILLPSWPVHRSLSFLLGTRDSLMYLSKLWLWACQLCLRTALMAPGRSWTTGVSGLWSQWGTPSLWRRPYSRLWKPRYHRRSCAKERKSSVLIGLLMLT